MKTLTRIVKYESQVIREYSAYGSYGGATLKLVDFEDLDTASKGYKNEKSVPGRVMIFETFEKFFKVCFNFSENFWPLVSKVSILHPCIHPPPPSRTT